MRILVDTNVLIDWLIHREGFWKEAKAIVAKCSDEDVTGCIAVHSITNIFYIFRSKTDFNARKSIYENMAKIFTIIPLDEEKVKKSVNNDSFSDVEDCLQAECAKEFGADYIVTRNIKDFINSAVPAIEPKEFLEMFGNQVGL